ncbi:fungal-specific transcription factor domain-containing protein [Podospora appendiculata]|uniref:Fungal-specific transcription factor domain-containing protein n=1 Tax=Podospora appendiculata TaxID=314037 RepID=A0AAE1CA91_9PEZI|nr:fungal-specific transcription factor domain-containing protein [Podospora appendiculata]
MPLSPPPAAASIGTGSDSPSGQSRQSDQNDPPLGALSAPASNPSQTSKSRVPSCILCHRRKVKCDKAVPCSTCKQGGIACVYPSTDRPPAWVRRMWKNRPQAGKEVPPAAQTPGPSARKLQERVKELESLVNDLRNQLEVHQSPQASAGTVTSASNSVTENNTTRDTSAFSESNLEDANQQFGRLIIDGTSQSRYVSSGFWSRVNDELDDLKKETGALVDAESDISDDHTSPEKDSERTPSDRHAFLFGHNIGSPGPAIEGLRPLPSQIPFLLTIYTNNVNMLLQIVHMPTVVKLTNDIRNDDSSLTHANEALLFAIYYAAIVSMEDEDVKKDFGFSKADLSLRFRAGFEHALAKADFLNVPDLVLVQAFVIFLLLVRLHESPRFVWMMTGLAIRMAQALGLHRDGAKLKHLTPYEIEIRRRVWWTLCVLDVRSSEDQGVDLTISHGMFDTNLPLNINDSEISPESEVQPSERNGETDMQLSLYTFQVCVITRRMMAPRPNNTVPSLEELEIMLNELYDTVNNRGFQGVAGITNPKYWVAVTVVRLVIAKMTLLLHLPALFSSSANNVIGETRTKLFHSALEVAEYNHALNSDKSYRHWRWIFQTYTHWYAIVFLLLEINRRQWSPTVERAWVALHSEWLIPDQSSMDKELRISVPLRKLIAKARRHRSTEVQRLRSDPHAVQLLELEDSQLPPPAQEGPLADQAARIHFLERWRELITPPPPLDIHYVGNVNVGPTEEAIPIEPLLADHRSPYQALMSSLNAQHKTHYGKNFPGSDNQSLSAMQDSFQGPPMGSGFTHLLWADADPSVDVFGDVLMDDSVIKMDTDNVMDWLDWLGTAAGVDKGRVPHDSTWGGL